MGKWTQPNFKLELESYPRTDLGVKKNFEEISFAHIYKEFNIKADLLSKESLTMQEILLEKQVFKQEILLEKQVFKGEAIVLVSVKSLFDTLQVVEGGWFLICS